MRELFAMMTRANVFWHTPLGSKVINGCICCRTCRERKPEDDFVYSRLRKDGTRGRRNICRKCDSRRASKSRRYRRG